MWTDETRARYDRSQLRYPSDLTDEEWALVKPVIPRAKRGGNKRTVDVREVVNGLMYVLSTGCQWHAMPKDLPLCREQADREVSPTAAIIDSQSVKSAEKGGHALIGRASMAARRSEARSDTSWSTRKAS